MNRLIAGAVALAMTGCASTPMVRSVDRTQPNTNLNAGEGATRASYLGEYALPRSRFTVTLSAPAATAPASAVSAAAPSVTNTITVTTTPSATPRESGDPKAGPDLAAWCRGHREAYNQRKRTLANASTRLIALKRSYYETFDLEDPYETGKAADEATKEDEAAEDRDAAGQAQENAEEDKDEAAHDPITLTAAEKRDWKARLLAEIPIMAAADRARIDNLAAEVVLEQSCPQPVRVLVTETVERDPTRIFSLYADYDDAASDQLALALDANGFITSLSGTTADRSGDALVGTVKTLAAVTTLVNPADLSQSALTGTVDDVIVMGLRQPCRLDGSAIARSGRLRARLNRTGSIDQEAMSCALALLEVPDDSPEIDIALPREISFLIPAPEKPDASTATKPINFDAVRGLGLTGEIKCAIGRRLRTEDAIGEGLVASTPTPCEIVIVRNSAELARANTWSLDSTRTTLLEVPRTPMVTQSAGYTFANGRQTGANWNRPSPTEQIVTLPVRMIGAVVEGVTAEAAGARGQTEAETARINAETARIQALVALAEARANLGDPDGAAQD